MCNFDENVETVVDNILNTVNNTMTTHEEGNADEPPRYNSYIVNEDYNNMEEENELIQQRGNKNRMENEIFPKKYNKTTMEQSTPDCDGSIARFLQSEPWENVEESVGDSLDEVVERILFAHSCEERYIYNESESEFDITHPTVYQPYTNTEKLNKTKCRPFGNERLLLHQNKNNNLSEFEESQREEEESQMESSLLSPSELSPCALPITIQEVEYHTPASQNFSRKDKIQSGDNYHDNRQASNNNHKESKFHNNDKFKENVLVEDNNKRRSRKPHSSVKERNYRQSQIPTTMLNCEMHAVNSLPEAPPEQLVYSFEHEGNVCADKTSMHNQRLSQIAVDDTYAKINKLPYTPQKYANELNLSRRELLLLRRLELWERRKEIRRVNALYERLLQEQNECTFKPNTLNSSSASNSCHSVNTRRSTDQKNENEKLHCRTRHSDYNTINKKSTDNHKCQLESSATNLNSNQQSIEHIENKKMCDSYYREDLLTPNKLYADNKAWGFDKYVLRMASARAQREKRKAEERAEVAKLTDPSNFDRRVTIPVPFSFHERKCHYKEISNQIAPTESDNTDKRDNTKKWTTKEKFHDNSFESRVNMAPSKSVKSELNEPESRHATSKTQDDACSAFDVVSSKIRQRLLFAPEMTAVLQRKNKY